MSKHIEPWAIEQHLKKFPKCEWLCTHSSQRNLGEEKPSPNTESDKSIDEIMKPLTDGGYHNNSEDKTRSNCYDCKRIETAKDQLYSLLMDVIEIDPANRFNCEALRIEQRTKLNELFNEKEE